MADPMKVLAERKARILEEAQKEAAEIDKDLEQLERLTSKYNLQVVEAAPAPAESAETGWTSKPVEVMPWAVTQKEPSTPDPRTSITKASISVAEEMIQIAGRPVPLATIFSALEKKGIAFKSKEPRSTLSAVLGQSGRLESIRGVGWWIKGRPLPKAPHDIFREDA